MRVVSILGTKKSGKTTVVERLVPVLKRRRLNVGTLKYIHHESFTVHAKGRDTTRHWEAGADTVLAVAPGETAMIHRTGGGHATLDEVRPLIPDETDVLLCEGLILAGHDVRTVVCTKNESEAVAMLAELPEDAHVIAVSGVVSKRGGHVAGLPALDSADETAVRSLAKLITK